MTPTSVTINPHAAHPTSLVALGKSLWRNRQLIVQMTKRDNLPLDQSVLLTSRSTGFSPAGS